MKKSSYTLIALLIICLGAITYLTIEKVGDQRQLKLLNEQAENLAKNLDDLRIEKLAWEGEKARVAQSIGSVQGVLRSTLDDLDIVVESIGKSLNTKAPVEVDTSTEAEKTPVPSPKSSPSSNARPDVMTETIATNPPRTAKATFYPTAQVTTVPSPASSVSPAPVSSTDKP